MAQNDTRSLYDLKRDAEISRAALAETVDQLRNSVSGVRERLAPDALKTEFTDYARERGERLMDAARRNPAQTAAIGALVAWPALAIARAIPLPIALISAGLFLTGTSKGRELARAATDRTSDIADEARSRAHDLRESSADAMGATADRVVDAATRVADRATAAVGAVADSAAPMMEQIRTTGADFARSVSQTASAAAHNAADVGAAAGERGRDALDDARARARGSTRALADWAGQNPLLIGGLGLLVGGFIASALPATAAERSVAGAVGVGVKTGLRAAAAQGMATAAGAAVRAAAAGLQPNDATFGTAGSAASAALGEDATGPGGRGATGG